MRHSPKKEINYIFSYEENYANCICEMFNKKNTRFKIYHYSYLIESYLC